MTPKEKAEELVEKFKFETKRSEVINDILLGDISVVFKHYKAKQCALISVDEVQRLIKDLSNCSYRFISIIDEMNFWQEVKQEIQKL